MKKIYLFAISALFSIQAFSQTTQSCFVQIVFSSSGNLCFGDCNGTANSFPVGTGPYTYMWSNGATTQNLTGLCQGGYTVTVTDIGASTTCVGNGNITCPALLIVNISPSGNTASAIASGGTFPYTYLWSPGGQTSMTATGLSTGIYTCVVTDANGCTASNTVNISITGESTNSLSSNTISIYPNPVSNMINIEFNTESKNALLFTITDLLGKLVHAEDLFTDKLLVRSIDVSTLNNGVYFVTVQFPNQVVTKKIVKN